LTIAGKISEDDFDLIRTDLIATTHAENVVYKRLAEDSKIDFECDVQL
jgi:hypothetical protein